MLYFNFLSHVLSQPSFLILLTYVGAAVIEEHSDGTIGGEKERRFSPSASLHSTLLRSIALISTAYSQDIMG